MGRVKWGKRGWSEAREGDVGGGEGEMRSGEGEVGGGESYVCQISYLQVIRLMKGEAREERPEVVVGDMSRPVCGACSHVRTHTHAHTHTHTHAHTHTHTHNCVCLNLCVSGHGEQH